MFGQKILGGQFSHQNSTYKEQYLKNQSFFVVVASKEYKITEMGKVKETTLFSLNHPESRTII